MNPSSQSPSSRLKERHRLETRAAILAAAEEVYSSHGLVGGRMDQIATLAGVSVGTLYNHFADRTALVRSLLDERRGELFALTDQALAAAGPRFSARLDALLAATLGHFARHRKLLALAVQAEADTGRLDLVGAAAKPSSTAVELLRRARDVMDLGLAEGVLRPADPGLLAALLVGMVRAALLRSLVEDQPFDPGDMATRLAALFLHGAAGAP